MRNRFEYSTFATLAFAAGFLLATAPAFGQAAYRAPRTADGKPNLNGIWQAMNTAHWDLEPHAAGPSVMPTMGSAFAVPGGLGVVEGDSIPYLPAALAKKKEKDTTQRETVYRFLLQAGAQMGATPGLDVVPDSAIDQSAAIALRRNPVQGV